MAFGFFKKNEYADTIFMGGKIYTQDPDLPWANAVACKDGLIIAVTDHEDLAELEGKNTEIVDLHGGVMLPGYIDTCGHPVMQAFQEACLYLTEGDLDSTMSQISEYASANQEAGVIFAYGYNEDILKGIEGDQAKAHLDQCCEDRPVIILGKSGFHCILNSMATDMVRAAAEEDEVPVITLPYLFGILEPIDLNALPENVPYSMGKYCERGFTSVFDCGAPDFLASLYLSMMVHIFQEEMIKQRFHGSLLVTRDLNPKTVMHKLSQFRTNCAELNGYINFRTLKLMVESSGDELSLSQEILEELCLEAGDKGFDVHIDAMGEAAIDASFQALASTRSAGYKKNAFTLAHSPVSGQAELTDNCIQANISEAVLMSGTQEHVRPGSREFNWRCIESARDVEEAVDMLTINAAIQLGISNEFGSVEKGKHADFSIFYENPLEAATLDDLKRIRAVKTVVEGVVVYDAEEDDISQWHSMLSEQQEQ